MLSDVSIAIVVVASVLSTLGIFVVGLRILARRAKSQKLEQDDYLIIVALVPEYEWRVLGQQLTSF